MEYHLGFEFVHEAVSSLKFPSHVASTSSRRKKKNIIIKECLQLMTTKSSIVSVHDTFNGKCMYFGILPLTYRKEKLTLRIQGGDDMYDDISIRIKENRKRMGLTQTELGEALGVQKSAIQKYESGIAHYKLETIIKLAQVFETSVSELIGEPLPKIDERHVMYQRFGAMGIELLELFNHLDESGRIKVVVYASDLIPKHGSNDSDEIPTR